MDHGTGRPADRDQAIDPTHAQMDMPPIGLRFMARLSRSADSRGLPNLGNESSPDFADGALRYRLSGGDWILRPKRRAWRRVRPLRAEARTTDVGKCQTGYNQEFPFDTACSPTGSMPAASEASRIVKKVT